MWLTLYCTSLVAQRLKASACNAGDLGSIPGSGRFPGEINGTPFQYSCLKNSTDRGVWWAIVHGIKKNQTCLRDHTFPFKISETPDSNIYLHCRRPGLDPWVGKIPWRNEMLGTAIFLPEEFHGILDSCSPWDSKEIDN